MAPINVGIDLGVKGFLKGTKDMEEALTDVSDAMEDVAKSGDKDVEKLTDKLKEAKRAADDAAESGTRLGKDFNKGTEKASEGMDDLNQNAKSNLKEVTASFDGSAQSIADGFQGLAAEAFEGFGPAGVLAGAAIAAGIGLATTAFQENEEKAKAAKERVRQFGLSIIDSGATAASLDQVIESLKLIVTNADDAPKKFKDIQKAAKETGIDAAQLTAAYAGNEEALQASAKAAQKAYEQEVRFNTANDEGSVALTGKAESLGKVATELQKMAADQAAAAQVEKDWLASGGNELVAKAQMLNAVNDSYDQLASSTADFINAETGLFDTAAYITAMQERETALKNYQTSLTTSGLTPEAQQFLNDQGVEAASQMLAGYQAAAPETKAELDRIWSEASKEASGSVETNLDGVVDKKRTAKIEAKADTKKAQDDLDNLIAARTAIIKVDFRDREGRPVG